MPHLRDIVGIEGGRNPGKPVDREGYRRWENQRLQVTHFEVKCVSVSGEKKGDILYSPRSLQSDDSQ